MQFIVNGLIAGSVYALVALGFSLIYSTVRFFHFAHGAVFTTGAYLAFTLHFLWHLPFLLSLGLSIFITGLFGLSLGFIIFEPMRRRRASSNVLLIASLGLFTLIQNSISIFFGDDVKTLQQGAVYEGIKFWGINITNIQIIIIISSIVAFFLTVLIMKYTKIGKALRAVANDIELSITVGIDTPKVVYSAYFIGSALAAAAAILISLDLQMTPMMGFNAMLYGVVAMLIGGLRNIFGAYWGGLFLGLVQHIGVLYLASKWQDTIAFAILILFLLFRPQGLLGKKSAKAHL